MHTSFFLNQNKKWNLLLSLGGMKIAQVKNKKVVWKKNKDKFERREREMNGLMEKRWEKWERLEVRGNSHYGTLGAMLQYD